MNTRLFSVKILLAFACIAFTPIAFACTNTLFNNNWNWAGSTAWVENSGDCRLRAAINDGDLPATALVSYARRDSAAPLRMRFTVDVSMLPPLVNPTRQVSLVRGMPQWVAEESTPGGPIFNVALMGFSTTKYVVRLSAWCADGVQNLCVVNSAAIDPSAFPLDVALIAETGPGPAGRVRIWLNANPDTEAPTLERSNLDNGAMQGIHRVLLGAFDTTPGFNHVAAGNPVFLGNIESSDDQIFWNAFEAPVVSNVSPNRPAVQPYTLVSSNTCPGSDRLPQVALGSTTLISAAIHPFYYPIGSYYSGSASFSLTTTGPDTLMMFLCPLGAGPSDPCLAVGTSNGVPLNADGLGGAYQLVIGTPNGVQECSSYTVVLTTPIGD